jgi:hypothetical protein
VQQRLQHVLGLVSLLAVGSVNAATAEAEVTQQIIEGRFDDLKRLEAASKASDPVAQFWWGLLQEGCVYNGCKPGDAQTLWLQSAKGGYGRARELLFASSPSGPEMTKLIKAIGEPKTADEKMAWAQSAMTSSAMSGAIDAKAAAAIKEVSRSAPTLYSVTMAGMIDGSLDVETLRAIVGAGYPAIALPAETLRRQVMINDRKSLKQLQDQAKAGDKPIAIAMCETLISLDGNPSLPADLVPLCVAALKQGQLRMAPVLLTHYLNLKDMNEAAKYGDLCMTLPIDCGEPLGNYLSAKLGSGSARQEWDQILALQSGADPSTVKASQAVYRKGFSRRMMIMEATRHCLARAYLRDQHLFASSPKCPWGQPRTSLALK